MGPDDVERAAAALEPHLPATPLQRSPAFSQETGARVHLKLESFQPIRAFKVRGALNRVMHIPEDDRSRGVITASAGNHGMGVAYAAAEFGLRATVFVPVAANPHKVEAIKRLGAQVVAAGANYGGAYGAAVAAQEKSHATFVHAYEDPHVIAGQGTIGLEILAQLPAVDTVIVPIGGGGLVGGIAMYLKQKKPGVRVVGVEPAGADAMSRSLAAGRVVTLERVETIADGLAASAPGELTLGLAQRYVDEVVIVQEEEMLRAMRLLFEWEHVLSEAAGAAAAAALLHPGMLRTGENAVVLVSGANVSDEIMLRALTAR